MDGDVLYRAVLPLALAASVACGGRASTHESDAGTFGSGGTGSGSIGGAGGAGAGAVGGVGGGGTSGMGATSADGGFAEGCASLTDFLQDCVEALKSCKTDDDCASAYAPPCSPFADFCDGTVYVNRNFDVKSWAVRNDEWQKCYGFCSVTCSETATAPQCSSGRCTAGCGDFGDSAQCADCLKRHCCQETRACAQSNCREFVDCTHGCPDPTDTTSSCVQGCMPSDLNAGAWNALALCMVSTCESVCRFF
jgi:hypothetical protein